MRPELARANRRLLGRLLLLSLAMFGLGFALIPLYDVICDLTGLNRGEVQALARNTQVDASRTVTVELVASVPDTVPLRLIAPNGPVRAHPGELVQIEYEVENLAGRPVVGQAVPSYGPAAAAEYFKKIECFCFREQRFAPGERRRLPVLFVLDRTIPRDLTVVTLSYTLFERPAPG